MVCLFKLCFFLPSRMTYNLHWKLYMIYQIIETEVNRPNVRFYINNLCVGVCLMHHGAVDARSFKCLWRCCSTSCPHKPGAWVSLGNPLLVESAPCSSLTCAPLWLCWGAMDVAAKSRRENVFCNLPVRSHSFSGLIFLGLTRTSVSSLTSRRLRWDSKANGGQSRVIALLPFA